MDELTVYEALNVMTRVIDAGLASFFNGSGLPIPVCWHRRGRAYFRVWRGKKYSTDYSYAYVSKGHGDIYPSGFNRPKKTFMKVLNVHMFDYLPYLGPYNLVKNPAQSMCGRLWNWRDSHGILAELDVVKDMLLVGRYDEAIAHYAAMVTEAQKPTAEDNEAAAEA